MPLARVLRAIKLTWVALVLWLEVGIFIAAGRRCHWPDPGVTHIIFSHPSPHLALTLFISHPRVHGADLLSLDRQGTGDATRVLIVADPQILNDMSYPERSPLLRTLSQIFADMNLRKAWRVAKSTRPHAVVFLGDMMDNGFANMHITKCVMGHAPPPPPPPSLFSALRVQALIPPSLLSSPPRLPSTLRCRYQEYVARFYSIFSTPPSLPVYYIPGNHDVGLENAPNTSANARPRYKTTFGPLSQHVVLGGHSLFMVDAPALVEEDWRRHSTGESRTNGLPKDLEYLRYLRAIHAPSEYI